MENSGEKRYTIEEWYELELPEGKYAELIDGVIYDMASPSRIHQELSGELYYEIKTYIRNKGGKCKVYPAPFDVQVFEEENTVLVPDISVICNRDKLTDRGCTGAPDWVIEIVSSGSIRHDYVDKLGLYMRAGVREYWIINPEDRSVIVYTADNPYIPRVLSFEDTIRTGIFEDLSIDFKKIMSIVEG